MRTINLLPPEARRRAQARRRRSFAIGLMLGYLLVLALFALFWGTKVTSAGNQLEDQQMVNEGIRAEIAKLESARLLKQSYDAKVDMMEVVLAIDIAWGRLLNDLGRVIPDRVWLEGFSGQVNPSEENPDLLGQISGNGVAFEYPDVAAWLRTVDSDQFPALDGAWVNSASLAAVGGAEVIQFDSVASLTQAALSDRLAERIPEVPE
ncbi:MAG: PilN domain-containing protein [Acidimicrobiia bacterium]